MCGPRPVRVDGMADMDDLIRENEELKRRLTEFQWIDIETFHDAVERRNYERELFEVMDEIEARRRTSAG